MNILHTNFHQGYGGGHTTYILSMIKNTEHIHHVACPPSCNLYKTLEGMNYPHLYPIDFTIKSHRVIKFIKTLRAFRKIINENKIDIVHTNGSPDNRMALYASILAKHKFSTVFTKHNTRKVHGFLSTKRFKGFNDAVIFVSPAAMTESGIKPDSPKYFIIPNGIDISYWKRKTPLHTDDKIRLVSTAGTVRTKGWIHLAEAIATLPKEMQKRLSTKVLGRYEPVFEEMQTRAKELCGMQFPGYFDDARPELEVGDVGFVLSYNEACSFACREMMAMGLPVISSDFPAHIINIDEKTGWVVKRRDHLTVAEVLKKILGMSQDELTKMKEQAIEKAQREFSLELNIEKTNAVYAFVSPKRG